MSSKEKGLSDKVHRESSKKRDSTKFCENDNLKVEQDERKLKDNKDLAKYKSQSDEKQKHKDRTMEQVNVKPKGDVDIDGASRHKKREEEKKINNDEDEKEERRRRRKEKEMLKKESDIKLSLESKGRDEKRSKKINYDDRNQILQKEDDGKRRNKSSKDGYNDAQKMNQDEFYDKNKIDKHKKDKEEFNSKFKTDKDESYIRNKTEKEESRNKHKKDREEFDYRETRDKEEYKYRHRKDKEESNIKEELRNKHRSNKEESNIKEELRNKHRSDKEESHGRHRSEKEPDKIENIRRYSLSKGATKEINISKKETFQIDNKIVKKNEDIEYEEDFDEYNDDDFENIDSSSPRINKDKVVTVETSHSPSLKNENELSSKIKITTKDVPKNQEGIHSSFINFKLAQKKCSNDAVANKMLSRAFDLSRLIDFDKSHFDIFDLAPVLEHSKYMRMFGRVGCEHEGSQTRDDDMARESQTEVIEKRTIWSQHPPLDDEGCVRVMMDTSLNNQYNFSLTNESNKTTLEILSENEVLSAPLIDILELMDRILEEEDTPEVTTKISSNHKGQQLMSLGYNKYCCEGSLCTLATFSSGNSCIFASIHEQTSKNEEERHDDRRCFVSIWRVSSNCREPQRILSCPSYSAAKCNITSLIFSPDPSSSHVIGGLDSGLIALWDLKEHSVSTEVEFGEPPAYLTGVLNDEVVHTHKGSVISLHTSCSENTYSSYQLLSLDTLGNLSIWIVSSLMHSGVWALASGSLADLSLRPGARSRMSIVATIPLFSGIKDITCSITCMTVDPSNSNQIFIGTNDGKIIHHERTTQKSVHDRAHNKGRVYGSAGNYETASITHIDFYPFFEPYILAGYNDGSMKIFFIGRVEPLLSFYDKHHNPVIMCKWSKSHPAVIFNLDTKGNLNVWNVLSDRYTPVLTQTLNGYIGFDLSSDSRWHIKEDKTVVNKARLLIWALGGSIEIHELHPSLVNVELDDCFKTCSLFQSLL